MRTPSRMRWAAVAASLALVTTASIASAQTTIVVSGPSNGANCFPFGCAPPQGPGTRFQQVYASSAFSGPIAINNIAFFADLPGTLNTMSFSIWLSTTTRPVDGLNTTDFNANLGTNTQLFGTYNISGASGAILEFNGAAYNYNPSQGNLLLDVRITSISAGGSTFFRGRNGPAGGNYSRAHNFGTGFEGFGIDTRFRGGPTQVVPEPSTYLLLATGLGAVGFVARRRKQVG